MRLIDQESNSGKIIRALGIGIGISVALANRRTSYKMTKTLIKEIFGLNEQPKNYSRYFHKLRKQKLVYIKEVGNDHIISLTDKGEEVFLRFNYEKLEIKQSKIWDRNFRMIIFDIPEIKRNARDSLRDKMKELGLVKFNNSVWIYPYPCQKEIDFVANYWKIGKYVHFALVKDVTNREYLEKYFNL
ncbi:MAG: hypothetical protein AAB595_01410 [Patescibacteria group bacterium]